MQAVHSLFLNLVGSSVSDEVTRCKTPMQAHLYKILGLLWVEFLGLLLYLLHGLRHCCLGMNAGDGEVRGGYALAVVAGRDRAGSKYSEADDDPHPTGV